MRDETFALESADPHPAGSDKGWYLFFVALPNQIYWVGGTTLGAVLDNPARGDHGLCEAPALLVTPLVHLRWTSMMVSIACGTLTYMALVQGWLTFLVGLAGLG